MRVLTKKRQIASSYRKMREALLAGAVRHRKFVGWRSGGNQFDVYYRETDGFWCLLRPIEDSYWCCFGTQNPEQYDGLEITCEINPPYSGENKRAAGRFVVDGEGHVYLTHSGRIGGGRLGIGKQSFLANYRGENLRSIHWPSGDNTDAVIVGDIESSLFGSYVGHFVNEVGRIKRLISEGGGASSVPGDSGSNDSFSPEFSGRRGWSSSRQEIEAECNHGLVVDALFKYLNERGYSPSNDRARDLYLRNNDGSVSYLFEVKTAVNTTSVYCAIGQLFINAKLDKGDPLKIILVPQSLTPTMAGAIKSLGICGLVYSFNAGVTQLPEELSALLEPVSKRE